MKTTLLFLSVFLSANLFGQTNNYSLFFDGVESDVTCNNPLENNMYEFCIMLYANFPQLDVGNDALITDWPAGGATFKIDQWNDGINNFLRMNLNTSDGSYELLHSLTNEDYNT